jgi:L-idonate 5-dehydrogenase
MRACVLHKANDLRIEEVADRPLAEREVRLRFGAGSICGSDLHYYYEGRVGDFAVREPLILGHEICGDVIEVGPGVEDVRVGQRVAVNPSRPCRQCEQCIRGHENLCAHMVFFGSAARFPHLQGVFCDSPVVLASQCLVVPDTLPHETLVFAEPLSVAAHAVTRAGSLLGRRVLVAGSGPIGVLIAMMARRAGAAFVAVTDVVDEPLALARRLAADETVNVATDGARGEVWRENRGTFDAAFEAAGNADALNTCVASTRPAGAVVQIGFMPGGTASVSMSQIMAKELQVRGSFRFHEEFAWSVGALVAGSIDVAPLVTGSYPVSRIDEAFAAARDRARNMKVQIHF